MQFSRPFPFTESQPPWALHQAWLDEFTTSLDTILPHINVDVLDVEDQGKLYYVFEDCKHCLRVKVELPRAKNTTPQTTVTMEHLDPPDLYSSAKVRWSSFVVLEYEDLQNIERMRYLFSTFFAAKSYYPLASSKKRLRVRRVDGHGQCLKTNRLIFFAGRIVNIYYLSARTLSLTCHGKTPEGQTVKWRKTLNRGEFTGKAPRLHDWLIYHPQQSRWCATTPTCNGSIHTTAE